ncbi:MAG: transglycosylase SLT domain-containing protein [Candidatus Eisenbacteria bacterium]
MTLVLALSTGCASGARLAAGPPGGSTAAADTVREVPELRAVPRPGTIPIAPGSGPVRRTATGFRWPRPLHGTGSPASPDSMRLWALRAADPDFREPALMRWSALLQARGDRVRADSVLASPELNRSIWGWEALRARVRLALARGDTLAADTLLLRPPMRLWPDTDHAARGLESARLAIARGDTARAVDRAFEGIRRFPGLPQGAASLRMLDTLLAARGDSMGLTDVRVAAEVEALRGAPAAGAARLSAILARSEPGDRGRIEYRIGELRRRARRWSDAIIALRSAASQAPDSTTLARVRLEIARAHRDAGRVDSALALYRQVAASTTDLTVRETALWERARELQDAGRFDAAESAFGEVAGLRGRRSAESRYLSGLMSFIGGRPGAALERWEGSPLEAARFWRGVVLRRRGDSRGDSLLRDIAATPGYGFYAAAARDSLGIRGMPDGLDAASWDGARTVASRVLKLAHAGLFDEALFLAARWAARDQRLPVATEDTLAHDQLASAHAAMLAGRPARAVGFAQRALREAAALSDTLQWALVPWSYPPAFESLVMAACDSLGLEPALVYATMRQESVFDPQARSTSNALGLMQLLMPAAQDAAGWAREPKPVTEGPLLDPATNVKWGTRYLARLIRRFDGHVPVALSAYNAGASTVPAFWRDLIATGGEALFCEVASNQDAQEYAKRILGYRQGYRELKPWTDR